MKVNEPSRLLGHIFHLNLPQFNSWEWISTFRSFLPIINGNYTSSFKYTIFTWEKHMTLFYAEVRVRQKESGLWCHIVRVLWTAQSTWTYFFYSLVYILTTRMVNGKGWSQFWAWVLHLSRINASKTLN